MDRPLGVVNLKNGERAQAHLVLGGDPIWMPRVLPFLGHKAQFWRWHIEEALAGRIRDLETRFYLLLLNGVLISNIMTIEADRAGILSHVFTLPEHRGKGAAGALLKLLTDDYVRRVPDGVLHLQTDYDTPGFHLYEKFGFVGLGDRLGHMRHNPNAEIDRKWFAADAASVDALRWSDWPKLTALTLYEPGDWLRSYVWNLLGPSSWESPFLKLLQLCTEGRARARVLRKSENDAVVGYACLTHDTSLAGAARILDFYLHPDFEGRAGDLLASLDLRERLVLAYLSSDSKARSDILKTLGWNQAGVLRGVMPRRDDELDLIIFQKG
jgi:GNAT superfamily N-acetyltransferase